MLGDDSVGRSFKLPTAKLITGVISTFFRHYILKMPFQELHLRPIIINLTMAPFILVNQLSTPGGKVST